MKYFLSIETNGLPEKDKTPSIIKIVLLNENGKIVFNEIFKPVSGSIDNTEYHGITNNMVKNKKTFSEFLQTKLINLFNKDPGCQIVLYMGDFTKKMINIHINSDIFSADEKLFLSNKINNNTIDLSKTIQEKYEVTQLYKNKKTKVALEKSYPFYNLVDNLLEEYHISDKTIKKTMHVLFLYINLNNMFSIENAKNIIQEIKNSNKNIVDSKNSTCELILKNSFGVLFINNEKLYLYPDNTVKKFFEDNKEPEVGTFNFDNNKIKIEINNRRYYLEDFKLNNFIIKIKEKEISSSNKNNIILNIDFNLLNGGTGTFYDKNETSKFKIVKNNVLSLDNIPAYLNSKGIKKYKLINFISNQNIGELYYIEDKNMIKLKINDLEINKYIDKHISYSAKYISEVSKINNHKKYNKIESSEAIYI